MPFVIARSCAACVDTACVDVCPTDVIHGPLPLDALRAGAPRPEGMQLFIDPDGCIDCAACVPECPVDAIFDEDELPEEFAGDAERNARFFRPDD